MKGRINESRGRMKEGRRRRWEVKEKERKKE